MNIFDQIREAIAPGEAARRLAPSAERERAVMAAREEFYKSVAENFVPMIAAPVTEKYARKTEAEIRFTAEVLAGCLGQNVTAWYARQI